MARFSICGIAFLSALAVTGCSRAPKDIAPYMARANQYLAEGSKDKATLELQQALKFQPYNAQANYALAQLEEQSGDLEAAVPHYARAAVPDAHLIPAQLRLIDILLDSNRYQEASGRINTTLGASPGNADALALRADLEDRQNQTAQALSDTNAALAVDSKNARALAVQAALLLRTNNTAQALVKIDQGLTAHPHDIRLMQLKAAVLITTDQPEKAAAALKSIVQSSPSNIAAQIALADLDAKSGRVDEALEGLKTAIATNPSNQALQLAFVQFLVAHKSVDEVPAYLRSMIASHQNECLYDLALAGFYRSKGMLDKSIPVLEAANARLNGNDQGRTVKVALANVLSDLGRVNEAFKEVNDVLATDSKNADALLFRGQLYMNGGNSLSAINDLLGAVQQDPANAKAFELLANAYLSQGLNSQAVDAMRRVVSLVPGDVSTQLKLAAFLQNAGNQTAAKELMARLKLEQPTNPLVWITDGQVAIFQKDLTEASYAIGRLQDFPAKAGYVALLEGEILTDKGDKAGAFSKLQNALSILPAPEPAVFKAFVSAAVAAGKAAAAADFLEQRAPVLQSESRWLARMAILDLDGRADRLPEATSSFRKLVAIDPDRPEPYLVFARILTERGRFDDARQILTEASNAGLPASKLLPTQGWIESMAGNIAAAQSLFRQAMLADPTSIEAANNYASIIADVEPKNHDALEEVRQRLSGAENVNDAGIVDTIAWLDYRLGRFDEAKALLENIKAGESSNPQLRFHMGAVLIATGNKDRGAAILDSVKALKFQGSDEARTLSAS